MTSAGGGDDEAAPAAEGEGKDRLQSSQRACTRDDCGCGGTPHAIWTISRGSSFPTRISVLDVWAQWRSEPDKPAGEGKGPGEQGMGKGEEINTVGYLFFFWFKHYQCIPRQDFNYFILSISLFQLYLYLYSTYIYYISIKYMYISLFNSIYICIYLYLIYLYLQI